MYQFLLNSVPVINTIQQDDFERNLKRVIDQLCEKELGDIILELLQRVEPYPLQTTKIVEPCFVALGFSETPTKRDEIKAQYHRMVKVTHPDCGGSHESSFDNAEECRQPNQATHRAREPIITIHALREVDRLILRRITMDISELGLNKTKENQMRDAGINTIGELLDFTPRRYNDYTQITGILPETEMSCIYVEPYKVETYKKKTIMVVARAKVVPTGEFISIVWFNQRWMETIARDTLHHKVIVAGKITYNAEYNNYSLAAPLVFSDDVDHGKIVYPIYSSIKGMTNEYLYGAVKKALDSGYDSDEILPDDIVSRYNLPDMRTTQKFLHAPKCIEDTERGRERIVFNDLLTFALQADWSQRETIAMSKYRIKSMKYVNEVVSYLPYALTYDQSETIKAMVSDGEKGRRINALLHGDVGCGKTIVAFLMAAAFISSGYQSAIMAPTSVLAKQHYNDFVELFEPLGIKVAFLAGEKLKKAEREEMLSGLADGSIHVAIGTTAILGDGVAFNNLALTVVDEEHKFGVKQRAAIIAKAKTGVHSISMSATPIPKSLATVIYGETIQLYTIRTLPAGRKPVITGIARDRKSIYKFLLKQARERHQAYVVCPMIDSNDDMEGVQSVEEIEKDYTAALGPYGVRFAVLTSRNKKDETEQIINQFKSGMIDVLISTTVIEVGINVPNATVMVITNAERFGLAGMHQLRGRVGRGPLQSYCVLESKSDIKEIARQRLDAMCCTHDGFALAEYDLKLRGAGDFLGSGTKQSGENKYMSLILAYPDKYEQAKEVAKELLDRGRGCCLLTQQVLG